ncbi:MAG: hypothetical protein RIS70_816 [Planctomycetota bacterium]
MHPLPSEYRVPRLAWLLIAVLSAWLLGPSLLARGMFFDGVIYATIARNMAAGIGDFWHPIYTNGQPHGFYDHPPLAFGLQAILFHLLGDQYWVERVYSALTAPCMMAVICLLWRAGSSQQSARIGGWFPVLIWMTIPTWNWLYQNNLQENTLAPLAALSVYASWRLHDASCGRARLGWAGLAAAAMLAAVLTKGPVGLFPAITPLIAGICFRDRCRKVVARNQLILLLLFGILIGLLGSYEPARAYFWKYSSQQLVGSLAGNRGTLHGRLYLIERTITGLSPPIALAVFGWLWMKRRSNAAGVVMHIPRQAAWFFFLTAACASFPLLISPRQAAMYAAPSYPFYVLALSGVAAPAFERLATKLAAWLATDRNDAIARLALASLLLAAGAVSVSRSGTIVRDAGPLQEVTRIASQVPTGSIVTWPVDLPMDWQLEAYLFRLHHVSLRPASLRPSASPVERYSLLPRSATTLAEQDCSGKTDLGRYQLYARAAGDTSPR